jgi:galactitol-specific phosphotransferase system IIB component
MKKIGVEIGLSMIADYLSNQGYQVQMLSEGMENNVSKFQNLDAIVVSDMNSDMMGNSDTSTKVPVINASGITQEEVKKLIDSKATGAK